MSLQSLIDSVCKCVKCGATVVEGCKCWDAAISSKPQPIPPDQILDGMRYDRWLALMKDDELPLTHEEMKAGWHWCWELDGLLVNFNSKDADGQFCTKDCRFIEKFPD